MEKLDQILFLQLVVARLGEKELLSWWNTDIAFKFGGADFLARLVGKESAPLAAAEGILTAARMKEDQLVANIPNDDARSLFSPETKLRNEISRRLHHFKRYPEDIPAEIVTILDSAKEWTVEELRSLLAASAGRVAVVIEGTGFGREVACASGAFADDFEATASLAARYGDLEKGAFVLHYYRSSHGR